MTPTISPSAYVAPTAVLCGNIEVGDDCRIMFGAIVVAEGAPIRIGRRSVLMENAIVRAWPNFPVWIGDDVMIGQGSTTNGARVEDQAFIATGATLFPRAVIGEKAIVRTNGVVHIDSHVPAGRVVPDGWTAIGQPAEMVPPGQDERTLVSLYGLNFTKAIFGEDRVRVGMQNYLDLFGAHANDHPVDRG